LKYVVIVVILLGKKNNIIMKVKYVRVSTIGQNTDRQKENRKDFDAVYEDKESGAISMAKRTNGSKLLEDITAGKITELWIHSLDRLGRDTIDVMKSLRLCEENKVTVVVENLGIRSMDKDGKPNSVFNLISGIVTTLADNERKNIAERCGEGRRIARRKGVRFGRRAGVTEKKSDWLKKPKVVSLLNTIKRKPYLTIRELSSLHKCSFQLVMKAKAEVV
jgi:DNA invertase Pin-like site-specific DNA recombinase